jgi:hypothetical protein
MSSSRPTKSTPAGQVYLSLRAKARREHRPTDELIQLYVLEGFLERLASSRQASRLVLKGGALLAAYDVRRPTRDVDLQARRLANDVDAVLELVREVAGVELPDGLVFDAEAATAETIRDGAEDEYSGIRVTLRCSLATAAIIFHVDVNVGDPIWPAPQRVTLPRLLGGEIALSGYPLPMVFAEKIVTAMQRGVANTRWRDFADMYLLASRHSVAGGDQRRAVVEVSEFRKAGLVPLTEVLDGFDAIGQSRWAQWRRKQKLEDRLPANFAEVLAADIRFADPVINNLVSGKTWDAQALAWE